MCGIAGIYNLKTKASVCEATLKKMCDQMIHRGPDGEGYYTNGPIGLGHRRLNIIDIESGKQPMSNSLETTWVTFNGEIYNFKDLQRILTQKGYRFRTRSDTETIIYAYDEWGEDCLRHLEGAFAFALWDNKRKKLFAARDRFGISPFFYFWDGKTFSFASEIQALLANDSIDRTLNRESILDYFHLGFILAPKTIYQSIQKLPQGHSLSLDVSGLVIRKYWDLADQPCGDLNLSDGEALSRFNDLFQQTIKTRLESDVPLGAFLSGGVDSTAVVQAMSNIGTNQVVTCSIQFKEKKFDESPFSLETARRLKTEHHSEIVDADLSSIDTLKKLVYYCGEPFGSSSIIPTFYVSKLAKKYVTVALSGDGGDETLGGYPRFRIDALERKLASFVPRFTKEWFHYLLMNIPSLNRGPFFYLAYKPFEAYFWGFSALKPFERKRFNNDFLKTIGNYHPKNIYKNYFEKVKKWDFFSAMQYVDINTYLVDEGIVKVDRMSMANSLETRSPFFNYQMVEWFFRLPKRFKTRKKQGKWLSKAWLARQGYSDNYLYRKKQGFSIPQADWIRTVYKTKIDSILEQDKLREVFCIDQLKKDWQRFLETPGKGSSFWWYLLIFSLWNEARKSGK